jgi:protein-arginine kinase activator protein McsA
MLCCLCKRQNAQVHITQFTGEKATPENLTAKFDLCNECAKKHERNDQVGFSIPDLLTAVKKARGE